MILGMKATTFYIKTGKWHDDKTSELEALKVLDVAL